MRHRLAIAAALLLALTGCSDDSPGPKASASTTPASASPSPTGPVAPVLPEAAKANTTIGAKAFVRFYFEALTYAMHTGDTALMDDFTAADCEACAGISAQIHKIHDPGGRTKGGGWFVDQLDEAPDSSAKLRRYVVIVNQPAQTLLGPTGEVVDRDPKQRFAFRVWASRQSGAWKLREVQEIR